MVDEQPALFHESPLNDGVFLAVESEDGSTLTVEGGGFSRQEMIDFARAVEFIDEQAWNERNVPFPAIVMTDVSSDETTASTTVIDFSATQRDTRPRVRNHTSSDRLPETIDGADMNAILVRVRPDSRRQRNPCNKSLTESVAQCP